MGRDAAFTLGNHQSRDSAIEKEVWRAVMDLQCRHCGAIKDQGEFSRLRKRNGTIGYRRVCLSCRSMQSKPAKKKYIEKAKLFGRWEAIFRKNNRQSDSRRRAAVFAYYGMSCSWCGDDYYPTLVIDHINNDGAKHRKVIGRSGSGTYRWLIANGFPEGFQTLCSGCNQAKQVNGGVLPEERKGWVQSLKAEVQRLRKKCGEPE